MKSENSQLRDQLFKACSEGWQAVEALVNEGKQPVSLAAWRNNLVNYVRHDLRYGKPPEKILHDWYHRHKYQALFDEMVDEPFFSSSVAHEV